jgi:hypothetical protein
MLDEHLVKLQHLPPIFPHNFHLPALRKGFNQQIQHYFASSCEDILCLHADRDTQIDDTMIRIQDGGYLWRANTGKWVSLEDSVYLYSATYGVT